MNSKSFYPLYKQGKLDPQCEALLRQIAAGNNPPLSTLTPRQARDDFLPKAWLGEPKKLSKIVQQDLPGPDGPIRVRIYTPEGRAPFPLLIFFHGGYFALGTLDEFEPLCTFLAGGAACMVISVDYRLAPEHKYPAAVEDAWAAVQWILVHAAEWQGDPKRIAVAGDSAGRNLAANVAMLARDRGLPPLIFQMLICPALDWSNFETDSFRFFGNGLWASKVSMLWSRDLYLQNPEQAFDPGVSPLLAKDLSGLASAHIITAEFDVLRDQGEAYAGRLKEAGVPVAYTCYRGMLHDFVTVPGLFDQAWKAIDEICGALKSAFKK
jgi:acetyl esterase